MRRGLVVDLFAGGGGASVGIEAALGRPVDIAINHSATALAVHAVNHPKTVHLTADIWEVRPKDVTRGRRVDVLWASPDCTHFSVAKGGKPREQGIRSLAWVVVDWAREVRPAVIFLENVGEFRTWGPLGEDGRPVKERMGETFAQWRGALELLGYQVDFRVLDASHYGAPTKRRRLFLVARCDGRSVRWPEPTHGPGLEPVHTAAECIDWALPCPSIFERKRPLAEKTLWRIAQGIKRFVIEDPAPFIVKVNHGGLQPRVEPLEEPLTTVTASRRGHAVVAPVMATIDQRGAGRASTRADSALPTTVTKNRHALIAPTLVQTSYGERPGQRPRYLDLHQPLGTVVAQGQKHALVATFLAKHFGGHMTPGADLGDPMSTVTAQDHHALVMSHLVKLRGECHSAGLEEPLPTITAGGNHIAEVRAFLTAYYGSDGTAGKGQSLRRPLRAVTTKARLGLVMVEGVEHQIIDIGMRMLEPHELLRAQFGRFAAEYDLSAATTKAAQVRLIGNSVCPEVAEAVVRANTEQFGARRVA